MQEMENLTYGHRVLSASMQLMVGELQVTLDPVNCYVIDCFACTPETAVEMMQEHSSAQLSRSAKCQLCATSQRTACVLAL